MSRANRRAGPRVESIVEILGTSRKYRDLCPQALEEAAVWAAERAPSVKGAVKLAKRKLHQITGAFVDRRDLGRIERAAAALVPGRPRREIEELCLSVLALHTSTRERLAWMDEFYSQLFSRLGPVESILDLACGLHPFAIPWMPLGPQTRYTAADIDCRLIRAVELFLSRLGRPAAARCGDILSDPGAPGGDKDEEHEVVFLFKVLPALERFRRGSARSAVIGAPGRRIVVTFPLRSLGGGERGMAAGYDGLMTGVTDGWEGTVERWTCREELCFLLERDAPGCRAPAS